jgi:hypothetical protein
MFKEKIYNISEYMGQVAFISLALGIASCAMDEKLRLTPPGGNDTRLGNYGK